MEDLPEKTISNFFRAFQQVLAVEALFQGLGVLSPPSPRAFSLLPPRAQASGNPSHTPSPLPGPELEATAQKATLDRDLPGYRAQDGKSPSPTLCLFFLFWCQLADPERGKLYLTNAAMLPCKLAVQKS